MDALKEIQSKGDLMMEAIKDQKEVLIDLRSEVDLAEMRLDDALRVTEDMEISKKKAENERLLAENETRMKDRKRYVKLNFLRSLHAKKRKKNC